VAAVLDWRQELDPDDRIPRHQIGAASVKVRLSPASKMLEAAECLEEETAEDAEERRSH